MSEIIVISEHSSPLPAEEIADRVESRSGCFDTHNVRWRNLLLLDGGLRTLTHVTSADAESARIALRHAGFSATKLFRVNYLYPNHDRHNLSPGPVSLLEYDGLKPLDDDRLILITHSLMKAQQQGNGLTFQFFQSTDSRHLFLITKPGLVTPEHDQLLMSLRSIGLSHQPCQSIPTCLNRENCH